MIDETEYTLHHLGVMITRTARKYGVTDLTTLNIGFGSYTTALLYICQPCHAKNFIRETPKSGILACCFDKKFLIINIHLKSAI